MNRNCVDLHLSEVGRPLSHQQLLAELAKYLRMLQENSQQRDPDLQPMSQELVEKCKDRNPAEVSGNTIDWGRLMVTADGS